jgi:hypothetical protein
MQLYNIRYWLLAAVVLLHTVIVWPGLLPPDMLSAYAEASMGSYGDHNPPLLAWVWHLLLQLHAGKASIFVFAQCLQYGAWYLWLRNLATVLDMAKYPWLIVLYFFSIFYPSLLLQNVYLVKDHFFAWSYFLVVACLTDATIKQRSLTWYTSVFCLVILFFGTAVKYQARFCLPVISLWLGVAMLPEYRRWQQLIVAICIWGAIHSSVQNINQYLVPAQKSSYAWQHVKMYDLAAISVATHTDLIPVYAKRQPFYSSERLFKEFSPAYVNPYIFPVDHIFQQLQDPVLLKSLWWHWLQVVVEHPVLYLKHRLRVFSYSLLGGMGYKYLQPYLPQQPVYNFLAYVGYRLVFAPCVLITLNFLYFFIAWYRYTRNNQQVSISKISMSILYINIMAICLALTMVFFTMAGTPRYLYFSMLFASISHPLVLWLLFPKLRLQVSPQ